MKVVTKIEVSKGKHSFWQIFLFWTQRSIFVRYFTWKHSEEIHSLFPLFRKVTDGNLYTTSMESNHHQFPLISNVRGKVPLSFSFSRTANLRVFFSGYHNLNLLKLKVNRYLSSLPSYSPLHTDTLSFISLTLARL